MKFYFRHSLGAHTAGYSGIIKKSFLFYLEHV